MPRLEEADERWTRTARISRSVDSDGCIPREGESSPRPRWGGARRSGAFTKKAWPLFQVLFLLLGVGILPSGMAQNTTTAPGNQTVPPTTVAPTAPDLDFESFPQCNYTTQEMALLTRQVVVEPCIIFDIRPDRLQIISYRTTLVTLVHVTPSGSGTCHNIRDGTPTSVELLNGQNGGQGLAVGFHKDYYIQFRLVSLIAGNSDNLGAQLYGLQHSAVLTAAVTALNADYIVGTCSFAAAHEKQAALDTKTVVLTQVGPPGFYLDGNPYVFGVHINSDDYPIPTVQDLAFQADNVAKDAPTSLHNLPVRVLYRTKAEFFNSTCQSALRALRKFGFTDVKEVSYDPDGDDDNDGVANGLDEDFVIGLADQTCPPGSGDYDKNLNPALFACVLKEQDTILRRWKENGCRPLSLWITSATWDWAKANPTLVPYMFGGGQWHEAFDYSDRFFASGTEMLVHNEEKFGYYGTYDVVVSYAIPMIFAAHMESFYRVVDDPHPEIDFATEEGYEALRRAMVVLNTDTIFGPLSFNEYQRNVGRGAAGTQWQKHTIDGNETYRNVLVSPTPQAEAASKIPAPSGVNCTPGFFVNETLVTEGGAILENKCDQCPVDTFTAVSNQYLHCNTCQEGSSTGGLTGQSSCVQENDNLLNAGALAFGYLAVSITWTLSLGFIGWLVKHRKDPIVQLSQFEFMILVCVGAFISSSTIIAISMQAGSDDDTDAATMGCKVAPFLYTIGWVLQYGSLTAKSVRLYKILNSQSRIRIKVKAHETMVIIFAVLLLDMIVVLTWTLTYPLEYVRHVTSVEVNEGTHVTTINSIGRCSISDGPSIWAFTGPLIAIHGLLMITTNIMLYKVRGVADRYQEQKYVALASAFVFEVLVIGLPVLVSVGENQVAVFIVLTGVIALNDIGMLCFVFVPKIMYQKEKIAEGVNVGETILKTTYKKASMRESMRRLPSTNGFSGISGLSNCSNVSQGDLSSRDVISSQFPSSGEGNRSSGDEDGMGELCDDDRGSGPQSLGAFSSHSRAMPSLACQSIMEASDEEDDSDIDLNQEQAKRRSSITPRTGSVSVEEDDESNAGDDENRWKEKLEDSNLRNYGLELELDKLREKERVLKSRVQELERLLASNPESC